MAIDLVRDLELDQPEDDIDFTNTRANSERMGAIRAYLATHLICSRPAIFWNSKTPLLTFDNWTATCCDLLADAQGQSAASASDQTLAWHVRLQHLMAETFQLTNNRGRRREYGEEQRVLLLVKGIEVQFREFQRLMPAEISAQREHETPKPHCL